jgi:hypothetical protein
MKIKRQVHSQGLALTLAASILAGCGGGGSDSTAPSPASTTAVSSSAASAAKPPTAGGTSTPATAPVAVPSPISAPSPVAAPAPNPVLPPLAVPAPVAAQTSAPVAAAPAVLWPAAKILNAGLLYGFSQTVGVQTISQSGNAAANEKSNVIRYAVAGRAPAGSIENTFDFQWNYSGAGDLEMIRHAGRYSVTTTPGSELKSCTVILGDSAGKLPEFGEIGDSAVLLAPRYCTQYNYAASGALTAAAQYNDGFWYSVKKSNLPNRVLVCIDSYLDRQTSLYCVRGFADGTLDTSKVPWLAEDSVTSASSTSPAPAPAPSPATAPAPTAMSSLVNMLATINDGGVITMPIFNYSQAGVYGPDGGLSRIAGQALLNATGSVDFYGNKKLSFRWTLTPPYLQMPASLNLRVLNGRIVTWEFSHDLTSNTLIVPTNTLAAMDQIGMYAPLSATRVEQQLATAYGNENNQARTPINWQLGYSGDLTEACLYMRRDTYWGPPEPVKFEWCWSHDQSRHRYVISSKSLRYVHGSDAGFGWTQ